MIPRKVKATIGVVVGAVGVVAAVLYRLRYETNSNVSARQRRVDEIIRECAGDEFDIYADD